MRKPAVDLGGGSGIWVGLLGPVGDTNYMLMTTRGSGGIKISVSLSIEQAAQLADALISPERIGLEEASRPPHLIGLDGLTD